MGNREVRWGESKREVLGGIALLGRGTGALTERLTVELIVVQLKAGGVLLCGTSIGGSRLCLDCPLVCFSSTIGQSNRMCW